MAETKIAPNPYSPYADADPDLRHSIASLFGSLPDAGVLCLTACERLAVAPPEGLKRDVLDEIAAGTLPEGMCPTCIAVVTGKGSAERRNPAVCEECGGDSSHRGLCALCRQELHKQWWPTRNSENGGEVFAR